MAKTIDYRTKLHSFRQEALFRLLSAEQQQFIFSLAERYRLTYQEFRQLTEACRDVSMWREQSIRDWWRETFPREHNNKAQFLNKLRARMRSLRAGLKNYPQTGLPKLPHYERNKVVAESSDKNIFGECPVESPLTVCCNLKTIDAVESCSFGCSYCTIQTFYSDKIVIDKDLEDKLNNLQLDANRRYHIGTGQSSDSLAFGNRNGILDALCRFAGNNPNVLLEFKTKSDNIRYFLENDVPPNIVCSWSLNPQIIIDNEEHFTASLEKRIAAARSVADRGVKVSFHFHPIVYYRGWQEDYQAIVEELLNRFSPQEVLFVSFGSVTFIKPVLKKIRALGLPTKIHQMELVPDPHGKLTYPDAIKIEKFTHMHRAFAPWHGKVFFYLCMEKADIWLKTFGFVYPDNDTFEADFLDQCFAKIERQPYPPGLRR